MLFNLVLSNIKEGLILYYFYKIWVSEAYLLSQDINVIPNIKSSLKKNEYEIQFTVWDWIFKEKPFRHSVY